MTATMNHLRHAFHSDRGPRETNQDTVLSIELPDGRWLAAVADGMGGLENGELASKTALGALYRHLSEGADLATAMMEANAAVHKESQGQDMGTTLVAALLKGNLAQIANVGDSRAYYFDPLGLIQVTRDHTMGEEAARDGSWAENDADSSPWAEALSRYLGAKEEVEVDYFGPLEIHEGGWILLCSDGLYRVFSTDEMEASLRKESNAEEAARRLVEEAVRRESQDNISVALVFRPGATAEIARPVNGQKDDSLWDPQKSLDRPQRSKTKKKSRTSLAIMLSLLIIPVLVVLVLMLRWWFSSGTG